MDVEEEKDATEFGKKKKKGRSSKKDEEAAVKMEDEALDGEGDVGVESTRLWV